MKNRFLIFFILAVLSVLPKTALAAEAENANNLFGVHLAVPQEEDLRDAAALVNSGGGDWGYVTLVIQENDRDEAKWQEIFDRLRELHLVPIIRLATQSQDGGWRRPAAAEADEWADFLDSLNWVVKDRLVVLFNEPNQAAEWGGRVDPAGYGRVALSFAEALRARNEDFVVMLAGFDAAAPNNPPHHEDEAVFLQQMKAGLGKESEKLWPLLGGLVSHSYPNHGFVGLAGAVGRVSVRGYQWELSQLKRLGVNQDLPVYITETGWPHREGKKEAPEFYPAEKVADLFQEYLLLLSNDSRVRAVTPFVLNYQDEPFDHFSWRRLESEKEFYPQYDAVLGMSKVRGEPEQKQVLTLSGRLPGKLVAHSVYALPMTVRNDGQAIWDSAGGDKLKLSGDNVPFEYFFSHLGRLKPFEEKTVWLYLRTGEAAEKVEARLELVRGEKELVKGQVWALAVAPRVKLVFEMEVWPVLTGLWPQLKANAEGLNLTVLTKEGKMIFKKQNLSLKEGRGVVDQVQNVILGEEYRLELAKPSYWPRTERLVFVEGENRVKFKPVWKLDFDGDGSWGWRDLWPF